MFQRYIGMEKAGKKLSDFSFSLFFLLEFSLFNFLKPPSRCTFPPFIDTFPFFLFLQLASP